MIILSKTFISFADGIFGAGAGGYLLSRPLIEHLKEDQ
jgi:hypothetical protein